MTTVRECMGIMWAGAEGHEEVLGISIYGYHSTNGALPTATSIETVWKPLGGKTKSHVIECEGCSVAVCDVRLGHWPSSVVWRNAVESSLRIIESAGAAVAWCGGEDCSWSPGVLDPNSGNGNVYAGFARAVGFVCLSPNLDDDCEYLGDRELELLFRELGTRP